MFKLFKKSKKENKSIESLKESLTAIGDGLDRMQEINDESIRVTQETIELVTIGQQQLEEMKASNDEFIKLCEESARITNELINSNKEVFNEIRANRMKEVM